MRSEIFQKIQENKRRFYRDLHPSSEPTVKYTQSSEPQDERYLPGTKALLLELKEKLIHGFPGRIKLKTAVRLPHIKYSMKIGATIRTPAFVIVFNRKLRGVMSMHRSRLDRFADQMLYFILVFFGEEQHVMQFVLAGRKRNADNLKSLVVSRTLSALIFMRRINKMKFSDTIPGKFLVPSKASVEHRNAFLATSIKALVKICNNLYIRIITFIITTAKVFIITSGKTLNSVVKRL